MPPDIVETKKKRGQGAKKEEKNGKKNGVKKEKKKIPLFTPFLFAKGRVWTWYWGLSACPLQHPYQ